MTDKVNKMGCVASRIDKEERVQVSKQRKRLMKQLVGFRGEFADAQLAYLRALKNTGGTLRQFTESESLEIENTALGFALPPSPPPPLPPPPPPPPNFSLDSKQVENNQKEEVGGEEMKEIAQCDTPPNLSWELLNLFSSYTPYPSEKDDMLESVDEENWAETMTDFEEDELTEEASTDVVAEPLPEKRQTAGSVYNNSSTMSSYAEETPEAGMVLWRSKKTLEGLAKELDDYFLKASDGVQEITVLMDINGSNRFLPQNFKENKSKYKIFVSI